MEVWIFRLWKSSDATTWSEAIQSSEAQSRSERLKLFRDSEEFRSSRMFRGLQEFRGCLLVMSHSEDEDVQKLNCEGLSEANHSKTNQTPSYQRFIRSKGILSHQRATSTTTYQAWWLVLRSTKMQRSQMMWSLSLGASCTL